MINPINHLYNANSTTELDSQDIGWNEFSRELQPPENILCDAEFRIRDFVPKNAQITYHYADYMEFNGYHFRNLQMRGQNPSFIQIETDFQIDESKRYYLNLDHCSTLIFGEPLASVNIIMNGQPVVQQYNPKNGGNFRQQHFDITQFLQEGRNVVEIRLDEKSQARYWLSTLCIYQK